MQVTVRIGRSLVRLKYCYLSATVNLEINLMTGSLLVGGFYCKELKQAHILQCSCLQNPTDKGTWWGYSPKGGKELD